MEGEKTIISDFEELFGISEETDGPDVDEPEDETPETEEETSDEDETTEEQNEEDDDESDDTVDDDDTQNQEDPEQKKKSKQKAKQQYAFAELRTQNKKLNNFVKSLGKAMGLADGTDVDVTLAEAQKLLLKKQSKDTNIPVEVLQEIEELRSLAAENKQLKLEKEVKEGFTNLANKYDLDADAMEEFAGYLAENGKNPLDGAEVDIEAEYIKLHQQDIIDAAVEAALKGEQERKEKAKKHAGGTPPGKAGEVGGNDKEISTVADLDKVFNSIDL